MLTTLDTREVSTGGVSQQNAFTIKANGKAFKVLIDGLYSDKIRAVIRELWSNAHDSHIAAGCGVKPFDCQLPTVWEPVFRVRDYGVSLSHDDVMHLYTTVFESTKDGTNTQVGKLGLGSKSPFAYSDTFTVTAWLDGERRTYSAFIGSDYVPQIAFMGAEETDEPNGLEVSFPAKAGDVSAFLTAARKVAYGFDVLPNITSGHNLDVDTPEIVMSDLPLWKLVKGYAGFMIPGAVAKQGCVLYPLDANAIPGVTEMQRAVLRSSFVIEFPIGDLEISASREALGYNEITCKNILRVVDVIANDVQRRYEGEINEAKTYWQALLSYHALMESALDDSIKSIISKGLKWRGRKLMQSLSMAGLLEKAGARGVTDGGVLAMHITSYRANKIKHLKWDPYKHWTLKPGEVTVYFEDVTKHTGLVGARIKYDRDQTCKTGKDVVWFKADPTSMAWRRLYVALGRPDLVDVSTLDRPPATAKGYSRSKVRVKAMTTRSSFEDTDICEEDDIVYVQMERGDLISPAGIGATTYQVSALRNHLCMLGYMQEDQPVVAIPNTHKRMIPRNPHWVSLWDLARKAVSERFNRAASARAEVLESILEDRECGLHRMIRAMLENGERFVHSGPAGRMLAKYIVVRDKMAPGSPFHNHLAALKIARIMGDRSPGPAFARKNPMPEFVEAMKQAYPLLQDLIPDYHDLNDDKRKRVIEYVNLIDSCQSNSQSEAA